MSNGRGAQSCCSPPSKSHQLSDHHHVAVSVYHRLWYITEQARRERFVRWKEKCPCENLICLSFFTCIYLYVCMFLSLSLKGLSPFLVFDSYLNFPFNFVLGLLSIINPRKRKRKPQTQECSEIFRAVNSARTWQRKKTAHYSNRQTKVILKTSEFFCVFLLYDSAQLLRQSLA